MLGYVNHLSDILSLNISFLILKGFMYSIARTHFCFRFRRNKKNGKTLGSHTPEFPAHHCVCCILCKSSALRRKYPFFGQVADFGLSREEMVTRNGANIRGTYGYLDPEYVSTRSFTKKSDVYSYGVLLFELIAGRNPQQGLIEYVELVSCLAPYSK